MFARPTVSTYNQYSQATLQLSSHQKKVCPLPAQKSYASNDHTYNSFCAVSHKAVSRDISSPN